MSPPPRIIHCLRAPVGGLFRHVCDLAVEQASMGLDVGVICDAATGGRRAEAALRRLEQSCTLGVHRVAMSRQIGPSDVAATRAVRKLAEHWAADVIHGHGSKGGAYARLAARALRKTRRDFRVFYTPHGGSLHFEPSSLAGRLYLGLERRLAPLTDGMIFECAYSARQFEAKVGIPSCPTRIIYNGLQAHEFYQVILAENPVDFLFVGELRKLKGVDLFLDALAGLNRISPVTGLLVGSGPDERAFRRQIKRLGLQKVVHFAGAMPAATAFARGRCLVIPSRAEAFPYIVLEAGAAQMPLIATDVGGIPEMVEGARMDLATPGSVVSLHRMMASFMDDSVPFVERSVLLQERIGMRFSVRDMTRKIVQFYFSELS